MKKYLKPSAEISKFEIEDEVMMDTSSTDPDSGRRLGRYSLILS